MIRFQTCLLFALTLPLAACAAGHRLAETPAPDAAVPQPADLVVLNAVVWTGIDGAPDAEAIAVRGDRVVAVGSTAAMQAHAGPATRIINAAGAW
jgi:hypothetical protein